MSCLRYYDESVLHYFSEFIIDDGVEENRPVQALLSTPSRLGVKLDISEDNTPIFPMIVVTRTSMAATNESFLLKSHVTRPHIFNRSANKNLYTGIEMMPYNLNYQIDLFALFKESYNILTEEILFKLYKNQYIRTFIELNGNRLITNPYIKDINNTDNTTYEKVEDTVNRIFHGTFTFTLCAYLFKDNYSTPVINKIQTSISTQSENENTTIVNEISI